MARALQFVIEGDPSSGVNAFKAINAELDKISKHTGFAGLAAMSKDIASISASTAALRQGAVAAGRAFKDMAGNIAGIGSRAREVTATLKAQTAEAHRALNALGKQRSEMAGIQRAARETATSVNTVRSNLTAATASGNALRSTLSGSSTVLGRMLTQAATLAQRLAQGARSAALQARSGLAGASQGVQSLGIGFRMSGIAIGNQLANLGNAGLGGILGGAAGAAAAGAELAVRLVTSFSGMAIRLLGSAANLLLVPLGSIVQGISGIVKSALSAAIGSTVGIATQAIGNLVSGLTNFAGEIVNQMGNVFTGIAEAARGAFQGAVSLAGNALSGLVGIASSVVDRVTGILGTLGKTVLGIGGTLGGFAFHDAMQTESGLKKGIVLLDDRLSPADERALRSWFEDLHTRLPTLSRQALGTTFQRVVSTGFGGDLAGAKALTEQAATLAFAAGEGEPGEAARVMAKSWSVFRDELEKFDDPFQRIADLLFNVVKVGDVAMGDLVNHLGEVLAPAKAVGLSFENLLTLIAKMSRTAGTEQTFTGLRRLLLEPLKMSKDAQALLTSRGINTFEMSDAERGAIAEKQRAVLKAEAEVREAEAARDEAPEVARRVRADQRVERKRLEIAKRHARGMEKDRIQSRIDALDLEVASYKPKESFAEDVKAKKAALKSLKDELKEMQGTLGSVTKDMPGFLKAIGERLNAREIEKVFPDIRAITAMFTLSNQDPRIAADIEKQMASLEHVVARAADQQANSIEVRLLRLWEGLKAPFKATLEQMRGPLLGFIDTAISGLKRLTEWWNKALVHPSLGRLLDNASGKIGGIFGGIFGGLSAPGQGGVWRALNDGLNTAWSAAKNVVDAVKTLGGAIAGVLGESETLKTVWEGLKSAGAWIGETFTQLKGGSTKNLTEGINSIKGVFTTLYGSAVSALAPLVEKAKGVYEWTVKAGASLWSGVTSFFSSLSAGLKVIAPLLLAVGSPGALAGGLLGGAALGAPGALAGAVAGGLLGRRGGGSGVGPALLAGGGRGGSPAVAAAVAAAAAGGGDYKGLLVRSPKYEAMVANMAPVMRPMVQGHLTVAERRALAIEKYNDASKSAYKRIDSRGMFPVQGPLMPPVWTYGDWKQTGTTLHHLPYEYGNRPGDPSLMTPENDWLFRKAGPVALTRSEGAAFMDRQIEERRRARLGRASAISDADAAEFDGSQSQRLMRQRFSRLGPRIDRALGWAGRNLGGIGLGVGMAGGALSAYAGDPASNLGKAGTLLGGIGTGAVMGNMLGPIGAAAGALLGFVMALKQVADAASEARAATFDMVRGSVNSRAAGMLSSGDAARTGLSYTDSIAAMRKEMESRNPVLSGAFAGEAGSDYGKYLLGMDEKIKATVATGLGEVFASLSRGDVSASNVSEFRSLFDTAKTIKGSSGGTLASEFVSGRGLSASDVEQSLAGWEKQVADAAAAAERATAAEKAKAEAIAEVNERLSSLSKYLATAEDALGEFANGDVSKKPLERATEFAKYANNLTAAADTLLGAIDALPEGSDEAAAALYDASNSARKFASVLRDAVKEAEGLAVNAPSAQDIVNSTPALKAIFGERLPDSEDVKKAKEEEDRNKAAQTALANAAEDAADSVSDLANSASSAAANVGGGGGSGTLYPHAADLTAGEARGRRKQLRAEEHRKRLLANTKFDENGNQIDPFTGMPSVGEFGGTGWGVRLGDGDMGFNGKPSRPSFKTAFNASGGNLSAFKASLGKDAVPSGSDGLGGNTKRAADNAGKVVPPAKKAADNLGKAADNLGDVADAVSDVAKKAGEAVNTTKNLASETRRKVGELADSVSELRGEVTAMASLKVSGVESAGL